ncbi:MAG: LEPR-XLL domain-containing protein [Sulfuritalea sp.]|nr:LEPR-XLL domain-containing protein [Sulfuritalea sp.]
MLRWFKNRSDSPSPEVDSGKSSADGSGLHSHGKFRLEPLEPRVLLSGDSIAVAIGYQALLNSGADDTGNPLTAIVETTKSDTVSASTSADGSDETSVASGSKVSVAWSDSWLASSRTDADSSAELRSGIDAESGGFASSSCRGR